MDLKSTQILRTEIFDIENPDVTIETVSEDVSIVESPDEKCYVEISAKSEKARVDAEMVNISASGNTLIVRTAKKNTGLRGLLTFNSAELYFVVKVPKGRYLKVKTVSADVDVDQIFDEVEIGSVSGDLYVHRNPTATCSLKTVSGDMKSRTFSACRYSLKSVSGDISILVAPGLEVDVDGKSVSGDLQSEISLSPSDDSSTAGAPIVTINATTVSGDFTLARN